MDIVENFFSSSPVSKWMEVLAFTKGTQLSRQAESITAKQFHHTAPAVLRYFRGRLAFLKCRSCKISDLIEFINRWKSGKTDQKLDFIQIKISNFEIPEDDVLNSTGAKYIGPTKKPPTHILPKLYTDYDGTRNTKPITSHAYVVRASDNHVASVLIQKNTFLFGVWDKTEEEFLKMVE
ncbi:hypothetical protein B9Z55_024163 [Caenorhabditis nigoni]|uniref:F-box associated domain-containing protein n=1 Tax=Caenorhabditis nigoni TaxID=1611254 RepID=A0A2G5ST12_9PELO|nr:hypothetical protein B9Z55_024163 [Caenorhabditis nigoni]